MVSQMSDLNPSTTYLTSGILSVDELNEIILNSSDKLASDEIINVNEDSAYEKG